MDLTNQVLGYAKATGCQLQGDDYTNYLIRLEIKIRKHRFEHVEELIKENVKEEKE